MEVPSKETLVQSQTHGKDTVVDLYKDGTIVQTGVDVRIIRSPDGRVLQENLESGVKLELLPDGTKIQTNPSGIKIVLKTDGTRTQTNVDGSTISFDGSGNVTQSMPNGPRVTLFRDGTKRISFDELTPQEDDDNMVTVVTEMRVLSDGRTVQVNYAPEERWNVVVREANRQIQKSTDGEIFCQYIGEDSSCLVTPDGMRRSRCEEGATEDRALYEELQSSIESAATFFNTIQVKEKLLRAEMALLTQTKEYEKQNGLLREKNQTLTKRLAVEVARVERQGGQIEYLLKQGNTSTSRSTTATQEASTQWSLTDAKSIFFQRQLTQEFKRERTESFSDPYMAATVVQELRTHITKLESEKEEVEDRLIDLRFSMEAQKRSSYNVLRRFLPSVLGVKNNKRALLPRAESLRKVLSEKRRESLRLSKESEDMKNDMLKLRDERDEAMAKVKELESQILSLKNSTQKELLCSIDEGLEEEEKETDTCIIPCIFEEVEVHLNLTPISPML